MDKGFYSSSSRINANIDRDVGLWLTSKLEEPWSSEKITAQITQELLTAIKPKFSSLEPNIKIGLLFSFLALRRKQITELEPFIKDIIIIGIEDEDEWVKTVSRLLNTLLAKQSAESNNNQINSIQNRFDDSQFTETKNALLKTISSLDRPIQFLPLEFKYLSTNLLPNPLPEAHTENSHFKLKTKVPHPSQPVVSTLGASIAPAAPKEPSTPKKAFNLFYEDQYSSPSTTPTLPPHSPPLMATITSASPPVPRAGRPSISTSSNALPTLQPPSNNTARTPNTPTLTSSTPSHSTTTTAPVSSAPRGNYLAQKKKMMVLDLSEVQALSQQGKKKKEIPSGQAETPTTDAPEKDKKEKKKRKKKESDETEQVSDSDKEKKKRKKKEKDDAEGEEKKAKKKGKKEKEEKLGGTPQIPITSATINPAKATLLNLGLPLNIPISLQNGQNASAMLSQALYNQPGIAVSSKIQPITSSMTIPGVSPSQNGAPVIRPTAVVVPPPKQAAIAPKPGVANPSPESLFDQSNVLSAEHKKVILAFLAGNRVNPYPQLGQVVQFLLHQEDKVTPDANKTPYIEQLIFEINYETGTWRKLRRKRMSQASTPGPTESSMPSLVGEPQ